ncbi:MULTISPECIES: hypothetical protein [unclassified Yoonia]|uniref:hypothetical protein n=1 Tax=unclassified Yoonia TaxID=2629118 RepID=UPI002AFFBD7D|nr:MULTISPECIES: hypothetical protein [unclassified Yoonia]
MSAPRNMAWVRTGIYTAVANFGEIVFTISPGGLSHWSLKQDPYLDGKPHEIAWSKSVAKLKEIANIFAASERRP